jgi:uncharacterized protein (TIGR00730 family)
MQHIKNICIFCGSRSGNLPIYTQTAEKIGQYLAENNIRLIYGAGNIGLMGVVADAVLAHKGNITGVIPHFLAEKEVAKQNIGELILVDTMHERKAIMADRADIFIALPGGFGTMDELCEILTWSQLGLHQKPIYLLNTNGFYNDLIRLFDNMTTTGFLSENHRQLLINVETVEELIEKIQFIPRLK